MADAGNTSLSTDAIDEALRTHASAFRRFVRARVPAGEVDDVLQMAALRALERAGSLQEPARVLPWLYRIHRNIMTDTLRERARHERVLERTRPPDMATIEEVEDPCDCILALARRLSPTYASMLSLVDAGDASLSDAATSLGISTNNATVRLHRARKALRKTLLDHCGVRNANDCNECRCALEG